MLINRHWVIMVYSEKLLKIIALMKCEDYHTKKLIQGCGNTMPVLSNTGNFDDGQVEFSC